MKKPDVLKDDELERKLDAITVADIGFDGRRLIKYRVQHETPSGEWVRYHQPTPIEFARELAEAQRDDTWDKAREQFKEMLEEFEVYIKQVIQENNGTHEGNLLIDPVCIAALDYYWDKLQSQLEEG